MIGIAWGESGTDHNWSLYIDSNGIIEIFGKPPKKELQLAKSYSKSIKNCSIQSPSNFSGFTGCFG